MTGTPETAIADTMAETATEQTSIETAVTSAPEITQPEPAQTVQPTEQTAAPEEPKPEDKPPVEEVKTEEPTAPFQPFEFVADNFTIPDGITYDPAQATDFHQTLNGIAERHGLTQEQAASIGQDMINLFAAKISNVDARISDLVSNSVSSATAAANEAVQKAIADRVAANNKALSEDREYLALGGDKAAQAFRAELFTPTERAEIDKVLTAAGLHNDPVLNKAFARMRHAMTSEGGTFVPGNQAPEQMDRYTKMYGPR